MSSTPESDHSGPVFVTQENPFVGLSRVEIDAEFTATGDHYASEYARNLSKLKELIAPLNRIHLLSMHAAYGLTAGITDSGDVQRRDEETTVLQSHVELLQAFALSILPSGEASEPARSETVQEVWDTLLALARAFAGKRYTQMAKADSIEKRKVLQVQEWLRFHTQYVRNWAHFGLVRELSRAIYAPLDTVYREAAGASASEIISVFEVLIAITDRRLSERGQRLRSVVGSPKTIPDLVASYCKSIGEGDAEAERLLQVLRRGNLTLERARALLVSYDDLQISSVHTYGVAEVAHASGLPIATVRVVLQRMSLGPGELKESEIENFFLDNPVWRRPVVELDEDLFYCPTPLTFFHALHPVMESLLRESDRPALTRRRAAFLEKRVRDDFVGAFPGAAAQASVKWRSGDTMYESDLLCRVDSYLFVVEAKSGAISAPAFRGAPGRIQKHVEELLISPSVQSQRLAEQVSDVIAGRRKADFFVEPLPFSLDGVNQVIRLSVTLEDFASIQTQIGGLASTGWVPAGLRLATTMSLPDLETVFGLLASPLERIHYLARRSDLNERLRILGHELDWLGLYLKTGFVFGEAELHEGLFVISGMAEAVDRYFVAIDAGKRLPKPAVPRSKLWSDIAGFMEGRDFPRWTEAAVMLLGVSEPDQRKLAHEFEKLSETVRRDPLGAEHRNVLICIPHGTGSDALAMLALRDCNYARRHELVLNVASQAFDNERIRRVVVLTRNVDSGTYPYSMLSVLMPE